MRKFVVAAVAFGVTAGGLVLAFSTKAKEPAFDAAVTIEPLVMHSQVDARRLPVTLVDDYTFVFKD
jgi:hypothetical protein